MNKKTLKENKLLILVGLTYLGLSLFRPQHALLSLQNSLYYLKEMFLVLPVIFILTVIIEAWIPKEVIMRRFGESSGVSGNLFSLMLGSLSAGPIYAAFPVCKMLLAKGASITNIVIILSAWAVVKVPMLVNEAKFLNPTFMAVRWVLTVIAIMIMGYTIALFIKKEDLVGYTDRGDNPSKNRLIIKDEYCIGCGVCVKLRPEYFVMNAKNRVEVKKNPTSSQSIEAAQIIVDKCPSKAISVNLYAKEEE